MTTETETHTPLPIPPVLHTARLTLRPMQQSDAPAIQRRFNDWEVVKYLNPANVPWPYPDDGAETYLRSSLKKRARYQWAITFREAPDDAIGLISLQPDDGVSREQRGFWLAREFWGRGLMTEAAERVTEHAFTDLGWDYLWLDNAEDNQGSHRVKEKQGAVIVDRVPFRWLAGEGMKVVWLLKREDWLKRRGEAGHGR